MKKSTYFKNSKDILKNMYIPDNKEVICDKMAIFREWKTFETPIMASEIVCEVCSEKAHYAVLVNPYAKDNSYVWFCGNRNCMTMQLENLPRTTNIPPIPQRSILWPSWCELNDLGDLNHSIRFNDIRQSQEKIKYMMSFVEKPSGLIIMEGTPGTGKTFASLGMCELFTRKSDSCMFLTQQKMMMRWMDSLKSIIYDNFVDKLKNISLLVVDDFGIGEVPAGFMKVFFEILDTRLQWSNRGTVITTNLKTKELAEVCGQALIDRFTTGQKFIFNEVSRREKKPI